MTFPSREQVNYIKKSYPKGTKIVVDNMEDIHAIPSGSICTVMSVDDIGQIHVEEYGLALIPNVDRFHKIK